jgi:hypothetical protein
MSVEQNLKMILEGTYISEATLYGSPKDKQAEIEHMQSVIAGYDRAIQQVKDNHSRHNDPDGDIKGLEEKKEKMQALIEKVKTGVIHAHR